ncbi:MAG TPA: hypothetical protein VFD32_16220 [Dehalococcoidia bacterium]|nr:hypothetical protein [Dehalococcoidia bacterium]
MRWTDVTANLSPEIYSDIVNRFTAGRGYAYLAARAAEHNAEAATVLRYLEEALQYLHEVQRLLAEHTAYALEPPPAPGADSAAAAAMPWHTFLATRGPAEASQLSAALRDAVYYARHAAEAITDNGEYAWLLRRLNDAMACLALARRLSTLMLFV